MRRLWITSVRLAGIALAGCTVLCIFLLIFLNTESGQDSVARLVDVLTGGEVKLSALRGRFPGSLRISRVEVADKDGAWLSLEKVALDWTPFALLRHHVQIERLSIGRADILRLPAGEEPESGGEASVIDIQTLDITRLETGASVSRTPMEFSVRGSMHYASLAALGAKLAVTRRDGMDIYRVDAAMQDGVVSGVADIQENANGLIAGLLGLNEIGPIRLHAQGSGPANANRIELTVEAGQLHAAGNGIIDMISKRGDVQFSGEAPAMALRPDLSWERVAIEGTARGPLGELAIETEGRMLNLNLAGNAAGEIHAHATGTGAKLGLTATAAGLKVAGLPPDLFARVPVIISGSTDLEVKSPVLDLKVSHPSMSVDGRLEFGERRTIHGTLNVPHLEQFAKTAGVDIRGRGTLTADVELARNASHIRLNGKIDAGGGNSLLARLLGTANIALDAQVEGNDIAISEARVQGAGIDSRLTGGMRNNALRLALSLSLSDLSRLTPNLKGNVLLQARARGPIETAKLEVSGTGNVATSGFAEQQLRLTVDATGLPVPSHGVFQMAGSFDRAPLILSGSLARNGRAIKLSVDRGDWKSLHASANLTFSEKTVPAGQANLQMSDLRDLGSLLGRPLEGMLGGTITLVDKAGKPSAKVDATATNIGVAEARIGQLKINGDILPAEKIGVALTASGISATGVSGAATARVSGSMSALGLQWDANLKDADGNPAKVTGAATLDAGSERFTLSALTANYRKQTASLQNPAVIALHDGVSAQRLNARIGNATLALSGHFVPTLDATASIQNLTADVLHAFTPLAAGTLSAAATLKGSLAAPEGTVTVQGRNLRFDRVPRSIPPASFEARADMNGGVASVSASLNAGPSVALNVTGDAPLAAGQAFQLTAKGNTDFAVLNPILSAEGRNLRGQLAVDFRLEGTREKPRIVGAAQLSGGEVQDYPHSLRVHDIAANVRFAGDTIEIVEISGRAGDGTITGKGSVDLAASGMPVSVAIEARNAQPVTSDRLRGNLDADIKIGGEATKQLRASGTITIRHGETILPDGLPPRVVTLSVTRHGEKAPAQRPARSNPAVALDLTLTSPGQFFVRGHGLEAELEGDLHIGGTDTNPLISGGLTMRQGTLDLAGQTLTFSMGRVTFDGAGLRNRLDPTLAFTAESTSGSVTAKLEVTGYASAPKVQLSSTPQVPQDEILARLLFQQSAKELSPFQLAQIAQAAASLSGLSGFDPVASLRRSLGLDRLAVSSSSGSGMATGSQTTIEAGKYIAGSVYVAAKQGLGNTTQAEVQIDLTKNLKAKATINTGTNVASTQGGSLQSLGSSVGLSYQFEY